MKKIKLLLFFLLLGSTLPAAAAAGREEPSRTMDQPDSASLTTSSKLIVIPKPVEDVGTKWARTCALCHATGVGGAPRIGIAEEWQPRLKKGKEVLLSHTIAGFKDMPPLGYCMSCDRQDFESLIDFMAGER